MRIIFGTITLLPESGPANGRTTVTLTDTGNCFGGSFDVTVGGGNATNETVVDSQHGTFKTPAHAEGAVDVVLTTSDGESVTKEDGFTYTEAVVVDTGPNLQRWRRPQWCGFSRRGRR